MYKLKQKNEKRKSTSVLSFLTRGYAKRRNGFLTRGYAKGRNGFLLGLRYANVSLAHSGVESS